ncbi:MAG TPA: hypothetical protein VLT86_20720 [Vicinamibacterales bacterium]|nr:hypothetical protein [Vicinamibacterales bacterium]
MVGGLQHARLTPQELFAAAVVVTVLSSGSPIRAAGPNPACALVTPAEIEAIVGAKVTRLVNGPSDLGNGVEVCTGTAGDVAITIRFVPNPSDAGARATVRVVDYARQMGSQIEATTAGPIACYTITPPEQMAQATPAGTMCSVRTPSRMAVIELSTKSPEGPVPMSKVQALARKILKRL